MGKKLKGVFAAITTPFEGEELALGPFRDNLTRYAETELEGVLVLGTVGEGCLLTDAESEALVAVSREGLGTSKKLLVGAGRSSTKATVELARRIAGLGADALVIQAPAFLPGPVDREVLRRFFLEVADQSPVPVILYNQPAANNIHLDARLVVELSAHENITGIKDSSGELALLGDTTPRMAQDFTFFIGSGGILLPAFMLGAAGGIVATAAVLPDVCVGIYRSFSAGKIEEARQLQLRIISVNRAVTELYGVAGLKHALDCAGFYGGDPRRPLEPLDAEKKTEVEELLREAGLLGS